MMQGKIYDPGEKTHKDENFPVASYVIGKKYRGAVLAFYQFARASDDIADHPQLSESEKIARLDQFEATLLGKNDIVTEALPLRAELTQRNLSSRHALDLLIAFRQDASKTRYQNWDELLNYCMYSAAPVGRFVLNVHGESPATWAASDALCSVLQIINHLQDCQADYLRLNRVYIPQDSLAAHGLNDTVLAQNQSPQAFKACLTEMVKKAQQHLMPPESFSIIKNTRLHIEVLIIDRIARHLLELLLVRDPLSQRVHLTKYQYFCVIVKTVLGQLSRACLVRNH
jgi:squalene synthase HpnC